VIDYNNSTWFLNQQFDTNDDDYDDDNFGEVDDPYDDFGHNDNDVDLDDWNGLSSESCKKMW
jgi:hypothetical protein